VAGAAADAGKTSGAARNPAGTGELATGTTDSVEAALAAGTAAGTTILAARAAAISVTAATTRILLENHVSRGRSGRARTRFGCRNGHYSHRRRNSTTNNKRFQHTENGHVSFFTPSTHVQNIEFHS
jgi:hypothetical protein